MTRSSQRVLLFVCAAMSPALARAQNGDSRPALAPSRGVAELPRKFAPLPRELSEKACTRTLKAGGNLQDALDRAKGGDVVCLAAGARYEGNFVLRRRSDADWVVVRTALAAADVTPPGERVRPSRSASLAKLVAQGGGANAAVRTEPGSRGWYLVHLEITSDSTLERGPTGIVLLGWQDGADESRQPRDLVLDRVYLHGWPDQTVRRCLALNSGATAVVDSWLDECHEKGADSQAIAGWGGSGPYLIENNTLAGAGENVIFGGADPRVPGLVPSDIVMRRNHIVTPIEWRRRWTKKNIIETKNVRRFLIEQNVLDGSWADGQEGFAFMVKSGNQNGRCNWCISADIVFRQNFVRNVGAGINVQGKGGAKWPTDSVSQRIEITENYVERVNAPPYTGGGRLWQFTSGARQVLASQNTTLGDQVTGSFVVDSRGKISAQGLVFERNVLTRGRYAAAGCGNPRVMMECLPGARMSGNVLIGGGAPQDRFLTGFVTVPSAGAAIGRAGVSRAAIDRYTAGVIVER